MASSSSRPANSSGIQLHEISNSSTDNEITSSPRQDNTQVAEQSNLDANNNTNTPVGGINYMPLCKAALVGDWNKAEEFFKTYPHAFNNVIAQGRETALHLAVRTGRSIDFVEKLLNMMSLDALEYKNSAHHTALVVSVIVGNIKAVDLLRTRHPRLLLIQDDTKSLPVHFAAKHGHKEMLKNLYQHTVKRCHDIDKDFIISHFVGEYGVKLLSHMITSNFVDIALDLVTTLPQLAITTTTSIDGFYPMKLLATKPELFCNGSNLNIWQRLIYACVPIKMDTLCNPSTTERDNPPEPTPDLKELPNLTTTDIENPIEGTAELAELPHSSRGIDTHFPSLGRKILSFGGTLCHKFSSIFTLINDQIVPCIKRIQDTKSTYHSSVELVKFMSGEIAKLEYPKPKEFLELALMSAAKSGIHEVVEEIICSFPHAIWFCDGETKRYVFEEAVMERHENVFNLIHQTSGHKQHLAYSRDDEENNILHLVSKLAPQKKLGHISGAALQMQRELQWFKEVEKMVNPFFTQLLNKKGKKPRTVFTEEHKDLITKGEKWMKSTAGSCSVVAALIATVVFAAAINVPKSINTQDHPNFWKMKAFIVFAISDYISFLSSTAAIMMFASIITARYAEDDFLYALPKRLMMGLFSLLLSIITVMIAFVSSIILVFGVSNPRLLILVSIPASVPVGLFAIFHLKLLIKMICSTYGRGIFRKQSDRIIY